VHMRRSDCTASLREFAMLQCSESQLDFPHRSVDFPQFLLQVPNFLLLVPNFLLQVPNFLFCFVLRAVIG
jgi:hypothetical protein